MSDKIVSINDDAAKHRILVNSFQAAAELLCRLDFEEAFSLDESVRYQHVAHLAKLMAAKVRCPDGYKSDFENAAIGVLLKTVIPNIAASYEGQADYDLLSSVRDAQKEPLINEFIVLAVDRKLLPEMLRPRCFG